MDTALRNRLVMATGLWRAHVQAPLPKLEPGDPYAQLEELELAVVDRLGTVATPENARELADATWSMVHDRNEEDRAKQAVVHLHEQLARLTHGR